MRSQPAPGDHYSICQIEHEIWRRNEETGDGEYEFTLTEALDMLPVNALPTRVQEVAGTEDAARRFKLYLDAMVGHEFEVLRAPAKGKRRERFVLEESWFPGDYWLRDVEDE